MNNLPIELLQEIFAVMTQSKQGLEKIKLLLFTCKRINDVIHGMANSFLHKNKMCVPSGSNNLLCWSSCLFKVCTFCLVPTKKDFYNEKYTVCCLCKHRIPSISQSSAKRIYKLTQKDLDDLPKEYIKNGYRRGALITMFLEKDVKRITESIHGNRLKELEAALNCVNLGCKWCFKIVSSKCENNKCKYCCKTCSYHVNLQRKLNNVF